jgi:hypothetical protein
MARLGNAPELKPAFVHPQEIVFHMPGPKGHARGLDGKTKVSLLPERNLN